MVRHDFVSDQWNHAMLSVDDSSERVWFFWYFDKTLDFIGWAETAKPFVFTIFIRFFSAVNNFLYNLSSDHLKSLYLMAKYKSRKHLMRKKKMKGFVWACLDFITWSKFLKCINKHVINLQFGIENGLWIRT